MKIIECYRILGIKPLSDREDDLEQIKKAYRKLALERHPDKGGAAEAFQQLSEAYVQLQDHRDKGADFDAEPVANPGENMNPGLSYIVVTSGSRMSANFQTSYDIAEWLLSESRGPALHREETPKVLAGKEAVLSLFSDERDQSVGGFLRNARVTIVIEVNLSKESVTALLNEIKASGQEAALTMAHAGSELTARQKLLSHTNNVIFSVNNLDRVDDIVNTVCPSEDEESDMRIKDAYKAQSDGHMELSRTVLQQANPSVFPEVQPAKQPASQASDEKKKKSGLRGRLKGLFGGSSATDKPEPDTSKSKSLTAPSPSPRPSSRH